MGRKLASSRVRAGMYTTNPFYDGFPGVSKDILTWHQTCPTGIFGWSIHSGCRSWIGAWGRRYTYEYGTTHESMPADDHSVCVCWYIKVRPTARQTLIIHPDTRQNFPILIQSTQFSIIWEKYTATYLAMTVPSIVQDGVHCDPPSGISVLIVGAGVAGLSAALECHRKGHSVRLIERSSSPSAAGKPLKEDLIIMTRL